MNAYLYSVYKLHTAFYLCNVDSNILKKKVSQMFTTVCVRTFFHWLDAFLHYLKQKTVFFFFFKAEGGRFIKTKRGYAAAVTGTIKSEDHGTQIALSGTHINVSVETITAHTQQ